MSEADILAPEVIDELLRAEERANDLGLADMTVLRMLRSHKALQEQCADPRSKDRRARVNVPDDRYAFSPGEAAKLIGVSRPTLYESLHSGALRGVKLGGRTLIPRDALVEYLSNLPAFSTRERPSG